MGDFGFVNFNVWVTIFWYNFCIFFGAMKLSKEKALEKRLDELKFYRGIVVSLIIGILGTLLLSYKTLENLLICGGIGIVIILIFILIPLTLKINERIKDIERI